MKEKWKDGEVEDVKGAGGRRKVKEAKGEVESSGGWRSGEEWREGKVGEGGEQCCHN